MFSKLARAFKPKSVKVVLNTPSTFNWKYETLPLSADLTNRSEESCTVENIEVQVREKQSDEEAGSNLWDQAGVAKYTHPVSMPISPGETTRVEIEMPISVEGTMGEEAPGWMRLAGRAIDAASRTAGGTNMFEVRVLVYTQGSKNPKTAVKTIGGGLRLG